MANFSYIARDATGKRITGEQEAQNENILAQALQNQGYSVISIEKEGGGLLAMEIPGPFSGIKKSEILAFTIQLSTLVGSGLPIVSSLEAVHGQTTNPKLKEIVLDVVDGVQSGLPLSDSLEKHPKVFDSLYVSMIRVGETGGLLDDVLERLAELLENQLTLTSEVRNSLIYPSILIVVAIGIITFLVAFVLPKFVGLFAQLNIELPPLTQNLINVANFLQAYWDMIILALVAIIIIFTQYIKTENGSLIWHRLLITVPPARSITRKMLVARFASIFGALTRSGIPILRSFQVLEDIIANKVYIDGIKQVANAVEQGQTIASPLEETGLFPPMLIRMVDAGENSGRLDVMLERSGKYFERELRSQIKVLVSFIEPAIILLMAGVVSFVVLAVMLPLLDLTKIAQG